MLNPEQKKAVETTEGALLILAGAGSGKTTVVQNRIAHMIKDHGVPPYQILAVTFTNKAAAELRERIEQTVGKEKADKVWAHTFHSLCVRILRREGENLSFIHPKFDHKFNIYDKNDMKSVMKKVIKEDLEEDIKTYPPDELLHYISLLKYELVDVESYNNYEPGHVYIDWERVEKVLQEKIPPDKYEILGKAYEYYQKRLALYKALDFDDLILKTVELFIKKPEVLQRWQDTFRYIMIDEYQDTNRAQYVLVYLLAQKYKNLGAVGDDSQAIYGFRGSDIRNILEFEKDYPEAEIITLEENYRSTSIILQAANEVISHNQMQRPKRLFTQKEGGEKIQYYTAYDSRSEARYVANEIKRALRKGYNYQDICILFRTNTQSRAFEETFNRTGIPYTLIGGVKFYDRMEIRDLISYLKFIQNSEDVQSFSRIINVPRRGLGKKTIELLIEQTNEKSLLDVLKDPQGVRLTKQARQGLEEFVTMIEKYIDLSKTMKIGAFLSQFVTESGYLQYISQMKDERSNERTENVAELISIAGNIENETEQGDLMGFLDHVKLQSDVDQNTDIRTVKMMTVHAAKGLEFPIVFLTGMEENLFPHRNSNDEFGIQEERRLCYVGITRAKELLYITNSSIRDVWGQREETIPSRFLQEFSEELVVSQQPQSSFFY